MSVTFFLFLLPFLLFSQYDQPSAREVVRRFYSRFDLSQTGYPDVAFEKRNGEWSVVFQRVDGNRLVPDQYYPFYIPHQQLFAPLPLDTFPDPQVVDPEDRIAPYELDLYDLNPSYGYSGWYKDVVQILEKEPVLSDSQLYALGRAWSAWSGHLLANTSGYAVETDIWNTPFQTNSLGPGQIKQFIEMSDRGIAAFRQLAERNPAFTTVVGPIHRKYANEVMWQYQNLMIYARGYADSLRLPASLYTGEELADARKWLGDCPPNTVLLSMGDNDFYPVHYLQKQEGLRTDVYLVNYNLLGMPRAVLRAQEMQYKARPLSFSVPPALYRDPRNEVIYLRPASRDFPVAGLRGFLSAGKRDEEGHLTLNAGSLSLARKTPGVAPRRLPLQGLSYLLLNHWILLDLLQQLRGRPFCTTQLFYDEGKILNPYLQQKGSLWVWKP